MSIGYKRKAASPGSWRVRSRPRYRRAAMAAINAGGVSHGVACFPLAARPRDKSPSCSCRLVCGVCNLRLIAKTWVERCESIPGLWWPHLLLALLIVGLIWNWPAPAQQRATTPVSRG
jgi:hypothetical protein